MKRFSMSAALVALLLATSPAPAAIETARPSLTLEIGAGSTFVLERPFRTVLIGDPDIVEVQTRSDRSVRLEPLNAGSTNLVFVDEQGQVITNLALLVRSARAI